MEDPGGAEDFKHGGWAFEIARGDEGDKFKLDETFATEALLLGRVTYDGFADAWPQRDGEFADKFNNMPKYVVGAGADPGRWSNVTVLEGDPVQAARRLREQVEGDLAGSSDARRAQAL